MDPEDLAAKALAEIEAKAAAHIASLRAAAAASKDRLEQGVLNLQSQAEPAAPVESTALTDEGWEFDLGTEAGASEDPAALAPDTETDAASEAFAVFDERPPFDGPATESHWTAYRSPSSRRLI